MLFSAVLFSAVEKAFGPVCSQAAVSWDVALWHLTDIGKAAAGCLLSGGIADIAEPGGHVCFLTQSGDIGQPFVLQ